jgi:hypothetical protein
MNATVWSAQLVVPVLPNRDHFRGPAFPRGSLLEYGSALFVTESPLTNSALADSAAAIGLNMASFQDETRRHVHAPRIRVRCPHPSES